MIDQRSVPLLAGVHPDLVRVLNKASEMGATFRVTEGLRTLDRQKQLVAKGASQTMKSRHIKAGNGFGHAVDIVPLVDLNHDGKISTEEMYAWPAYYPLALLMKAAAAAVGVPIEWGGDWKTFKDGPHWQLPWASHPGV